MATEKELRLQLGQIIRAHRDGNKELRERLQTNFLRGLSELKKTNPTTGTKIEGLYTKWISRDALRQVRPRKKPVAKKTVRKQPRRPR